MSDRVQEILSWYRSENPGVLDKLYRILMQGRLGGHGADGDPARGPGL